MRINVLVKWIKNNLSTKEIVNLYNEYVGGNRWRSCQSIDKFYRISHRIGCPSDIDCVLTGSASEILKSIDTKNFNINDEWMWYNALYGYQTFNSQDIADDNSPIDLEEIAEYIIREDNYLFLSIYVYAEEYKQAYREIKKLLESNRYEDIIVEFFDNDWHFNGNEKELYRILYGFLEQNEDIDKNYLADALSEVIDNLIFEDNNK